MKTMGPPFFPLIFDRATFISNVKSGYRKCIKFKYPLNIRMEHFASIENEHPPPQINNILSTLAGTIIRILSEAILRVLGEGSMMTRIMVSRIENQQFMETLFHLALLSVP